MGVIEDIRAGNREAIKDVYKENVKDVYNFAKSITGSHETALDATKKTFVILFNRIQKGETPTNIRLAALKIAYDEACAIAMPSTDAIDSPYDRDRAQEPVGFKVNETAKSVSADESGAMSDEQEEAPQPDENENGLYREEEEPEEEYVYGPFYDDASATVPLSDMSPSYYEEEPVRQEQSEEEANPEGSPDEESAQETYEEDEEDEEEHSKRKKGKGALSVILLIINIVLIVLLIWFVLGLLQNVGIIPENVNMGHQWFNKAIYPLF